MSRCSLAVPPFGFADQPARRAKVPSWLLGEAMPPAGASRTVYIDPCTHHVHVRHGERMRFISECGQFGHHFNGTQGDTSFELLEVAPAALLEHAVRVYVASVPSLGWAEAARRLKSPRPERPACSPPRVP